MLPKQFENFRDNNSLNIPQDKKKMRICLLVFEAPRQNRFLQLSPKQMREQETWNKNSTPLLCCDEVKDKSSWLKNEETRCYLRR